MATIDLNENSDRRAADVLADMELSDDANALLAGDSNTRALLDELTEAELFADGFAALARALPKNFAIVWARECLRAAGSDTDSGSAARCLDIADAWLKGADETLRRQAMEAAEEAGLGSPEAWLAAAVGWSSGSLAPADQAEIRPPDHLTAIAVSACLSMLAASRPESYAELGREMIDRGLAMVATG